MQMLCYNNKKYSQWYDFSAYWQCPKQYYSINFQHIKLIIPDFSIEKFV